MAFNSLINILSCEVCGASLRLDVEETMRFYDSYIISSIGEELIKSIDAIMAKSIVYRCDSCKQIYKRTYKDIEKSARKKLTEKFLLYYNRDSVRSTAYKNKYFVYCGKCNGFDGLGCCPSQIFEKCEIKRFPIDVI